jgi:hypothetical protein
MSHLTYIYEKLKYKEFLIYQTSIISIVENCSIAKYPYLVLDFTTILKIIEKRIEF